jgi:DNA-binding transcriptional MerR regulator
MAKYNIKDLEQITGIKAHTIRIWEKRYNLIHPNRTETNFRTYNDDQLKKLLNIAILNRSGLKISKIALLEQEAIAQKVADYLQTDTNTVQKIDSLLQPLMDLDEVDFIKKMDGFIVELGMESTMVEIIYPFLNKVGALWLSDSISPAQEHFVSNIVRHKIIAETDKFTFISPNSKTFLLFLPEHEMHELSLLFSNYLIRKRGHRVIYLGQFVPFADIQKVCKDLPSIDYIISSFTAPFPDSDLQSYIDNLSKEVKGKTIILSGFQIQHNSLKLPSNIKSFKQINGFIKHLDSSFV